MPPLPALSIRQPWAWAVCAGHKDVENRSWRTKYRGRFAIHAAGRVPGATDRDWIRTTIGIDVPVDLPRGALIGAATLVDVVVASASRWASPGQLHWILADAEVWGEPIPCRGRLGFFSPPELQALR